MRTSMACILVLGITAAQTAFAVDLDAANQHEPAEASILSGEAVGTDTIVPAGELDVAISDRGDSTAAALKGCVVLAAVAAGILAYRVHVSNQRMVALLRQQAMDDALLAAMSRDFEGAHTAIQNAELLQASPECIRMLYGEVEIFYLIPVVSKSLRHHRLLPLAVNIGMTGETFLRLFKAFIRIFAEKLLPCPFTVLPARRTCPC